MGGQCSKMLIKTKKLPKNVEAERKALYASKEGKALLAGAQQLQNNIQGIADAAMRAAKREKGTTGMDFDEMDNVLDKFSEHSHAPAVRTNSRYSSAAVSRYEWKDGVWVKLVYPAKS